MAGLMKSPGLMVPAPLLVDDEAVCLAVISRLAWIWRQQGKVEKQGRQTARDYVSGESHHCGGSNGRLITDSPSPPCYSDTA